MAPHTSGAVNYLKPQEEEWREVFNRLTERFPTVKKEVVAKILREHQGHAGSAAGALRDMTSANVKEADPDDVEHVSTLLSSPAMFKHACKEQFKKFDVNRDGVLEWEEVKDLTNNLYAEFGLQTPAEGALKAFFFATDENCDGVLSEREFRKFFEMFLRYAFFDHLKLRQMVEKGQEIEQKRLALGIKPGQTMPKEARDNADADTVSPQDSRASSASESSKPIKPPSSDEAYPAKVTKPDAPEVVPEPPRGGRRSPTNNREKRESRDPREEKASRHRERAERTPLESGEAQGMRVVAGNGVAFRASADFQDRIDSVCARGQAVQVLETWVRTPDGWLPVTDQQGQTLLERCSIETDGHSRKRVSIQEQRDDTLDREKQRSAAQHPPQKTPSAPRSPQPQARGGGAKSVSINNEEWRGVFENLCKRFPAIEESKIAEALNDNDGHAGKAASTLRYMS